MPFAGRAPTTLNAVGRAAGRRPAVQASVIRFMRTSFRVRSKTKKKAPDFGLRGFVGSISERTYLGGWNGTGRYKPHPGLHGMTASFSRLLAESDVLCGQDWIRNSFMGTGQTRVM